MKLYSWNVNGIRAVYKKGFLDWLHETEPDILGVQETKASFDQLPKKLRQPEAYYTYWAAAEKKGYSGVGLYSKIEPNDVQVGLGIEEFDREGRTLIAEYDDFVLLNAYFPNGGSQNKRVPFKMRYKAAFLEYCNTQREAGKSVIFCGDVNTAHQPVDLARPEDNEDNTGFLPEERAWIDEVIEAGYVDTFRHLHPNRTDAYAYWSYRTNARDRNVGWRIDYFFVSDDLLPRLVDAEIHTDVYGSDHCPISLTIE